MYGVCMNDKGVVGGIPSSSLVSNTLFTVDAATERRLTLGHGRVNIPRHNGIHANPKPPQLMRQRRRQPYTLISTTPSFSTPHPTPQQQAKTHLPNCPALAAE